MMGSFSYGELKIFTGDANLPLAKKISDYLLRPLGDLHISQFSDEEIYTRYKESVRGCDVFIIQPNNSPAKHLIELLWAIRGAKSASARRITAVIPYFGYSRSDRKAKPRETIGAKLWADLITAAGTDRVLLIDLHASQITGFFPIQVTPDHLYAKPVFVKYFKKYFSNLKNLMILAPDVGASSMARSYTEEMNDIAWAVANKKRDKNTREAMIINIVGEVAGRNILIIDDLIDTANTLIKAAEKARESGALKIYAAATHPVLSGNAISNLQKSIIEKIFVSDSIYLPPEKMIDKIEIISIASLLGESIKRIHSDESVSEQFD